MLLLVSLGYDKFVMSPDQFTSLCTALDSVVKVDGYRDHTLSQEPFKLTCEAVSNDFITEIKRRAVLETK